jgi:hypothetical protein
MPNLSLRRTALARKAEPLATSPAVYPELGAAWSLLDQPAGYRLEE